VIGGGSGQTQRKRPWLAVVLAFIYPGLGHVYLRKWGRALLWFAMILASTMVLIPEGAAPSELSVEAITASAEAVPTGVSLFVLALSLLSVLDAYWLATRANEVAQQRTDDGEEVDVGDCPHCGKELDEDLDFCPWCTERLVEPDEDEPTTG
jgi:hypothetical protein